MTASSSGYALITGASSGIGSEFARLCARQGYQLVLTARSRERLEHLAQDIRRNYGVEVELICADLRRPQEVSTVVERLKREDKPVELLINNAGFGLGKSFDAAPVEAHLDQVEVLAKVPLQLMHTALHLMLARGRGRIINVASVAAFLSGGTYSAVKGFVVSISKSASNQYRHRGVKVSALCPGLTRSDFHKNMGQTEPKVPRFFWLDPQKVAAEALAANQAGKAVIVPSLTYKILVFAARLVPSRLSSALIARTRNY
ncbi:MAG: SDR family oxidoreductase [Rothia sp. (in: high G+C Gram-positive bacteria)]|nr:SDR family oxidoreductase [Rothia sp. (in: high G+C Gram-positive bacteria)]